MVTTSVGVVLLTALRLRDWPDIDVASDGTACDSAADMHADGTPLRGARTPSRIGSPARAVAISVRIRPLLHAVLTKQVNVCWSSSAVVSGVCAPCCRRMSCRLAAMAPSSLWRITLWDMSAMRAVMCWCSAVPSISCVRVPTSDPGDGRWKWAKRHS